MKCELYINLYIFYYFKNCLFSILVFHFIFINFDSCSSVIKNGLIHLFKSNNKLLFTSYLQYSFYARKDLRVYGVQTNLAFKIYKKKLVACIIHNDTHQIFDSTKIMELSQFSYLKIDYFRLWFSKIT